VQHAFCFEASVPAGGECVQLKNCQRGNKAETPFNAGKGEKKWKKAKKGKEEKFKAVWVPIIEVLGEDIEKGSAATIAATTANTKARPRKLMISSWLHTRFLHSSQLQAFHNWISGEGRTQFLGFVVWDSTLFHRHSESLYSGHR
jgi:hypothetical protein